MLAWLAEIPYIFYLAPYSNVLRVAYIFYHCNSHSGRLDIEDVAVPRSASELHGEEGI